MSTEADDMGQSIRITHFINPHMFWFIATDTPMLTMPMEQIEIEHQINLHFHERKRSHVKSYDPREGEIVAVFDVSKGRIIRAKVDKIMEFNHQETKYVLWAMDYGVPFNSTKKFIRKLPSEYQKEFEFIQFGGLHGVVPVKSKYNYETEETELVHCDSWSKVAVDIVETIVNDSEEMYFRVMEKIPAQNQQFGMVTATTHKMKNVDLTRQLVKSKFAVPVPNFCEMLYRIKTNKLNRFGDNECLVNLKYRENGPHHDIELNNLPIEKSFDDFEDATIQKETIDKVNRWNIQNEKSMKQELKLDKVSSTTKKIVEPIPLLVHIPVQQTSKTSRSCSKSQISEIMIWTPSQIMKLRTKEVRPPHDNVDSVLQMKREETNSGSDVSSVGSKMSKTQRALHFLSQNESQNGTAITESSKQIRTMPNIVPAGYDIGSLQRKDKDVKSQASGVKGKSQFGNNSTSNRAAASSVSRSQSVAHSKRDEREPSASSEAVKIPISRFRLAIEEEQCLPKKLSGQRVLVHGHQLEKPVDFRNANFTENVFHSWERLGFRQNYRVQTYAWSHLMRRRSFVAINSPKTGKTMSFIPALVSLIQFDKQENAIESGVGPVAVVVCLQSHHAESLKHQFDQFNINVVVAFGMLDMRKVQARLYNGCDILVVTPPCFTRLYNSNRNMFDGRRIKHLVFDDFDSCLEHFESDLDKIFNVCREGNKDDFQLVVTSKTWKPILRKFIDTYNAVLCIGAYIEASLYGQCQFKHEMLASDKKLEAISKFCAHGRSEHEKTIVICNDITEVEALTEWLRCSRIICQSAHEDSSTKDLESLCSWNEHDHDNNLMICSDAVLIDLKVTKAQNLIHFSLPKSWSVFCSRFSVLFEYYPSFTSDVQRKNPVSLVLIDENNNLQLPRFIKFMNRAGHYRTEWPDKILTLSRSIQERREDEKAGTIGRAPLCASLLEFGKCPDEFNCNERHMFIEFDVIDKPTLGKVKLHVLEIYSPVHYSARITAREINGKWKNANTLFAAFSMEFSQYFADPKNRKDHHPIAVGDLCVIAKDTETDFNRCEITAIDKDHRKTMHSNFDVKFKMIDTGKKSQCKSSELMMLPDKFKTFPAQAIDIRLTGIIPLDFERKWNRNVLNKIKTWTNHKYNNDVYLEGNAVLAIRNTIWVDSLVLVEDLANINVQVGNLYFKEKLILEKYCQRDDTAINVLRPMIQSKEKALMDQIRFEDPEDSDKESTISNLSEPVNDELQSFELSSTGSLYDTATDDDLPETVEEESFDESWSAMEGLECFHISLAVFKTPNCFYIQRMDQIAGFKVIEKCIAEFLANDDDTTFRSSAAHMNCLAKYDGVYSRAKIIEQLDPLTVKVFLVDIGETLACQTIDLCRTTKKIVEVTPYMAMMCNMVGVKSKDSENWTEKLLDAIWDEILDPCQTLFARVMKPSSHLPPVYGMASYDVLLIDCTTTRDVKINKKLIEVGYAVTDPATNHYMDYIVTKKKKLANLEKGNDDDSTDEDEDGKANWEKCFGIRNKEFCTTEAHEDGGAEDYRMEFEFDENDTKQLLRSMFPNLADEELPKVASKLSQPAIIEEITDAAEMHKVLNAKDSSLKAAKTGQILAAKNNSLDSDDDLLQLQPCVEKISPAPASEMPALVTEYKHAKVMWQQTESMIRLVIQAPDIKDYKLTASSSLFQYVHYYDDEAKDKEICNINLFGCIEPKFTSHELRGLNVTVRLMKSYKGIMWPRLMVGHSPEYNWLKYNYDSIADDEITTSTTVKYHVPSPDDSDFEYISDNELVEND